MKSGKKIHQDVEELDDEEFGSVKEATTSNNNTKDGNVSDKISAMRSKHSVTEQRRRSKINERFRILRELIPNSDQKRDTASFLLEVIEYVQYLQEKVQTYEGPYQPWSSEPTKLMPWRNNHWRVQSLSSQPQSIKNGSSQHNPVQSDPAREASYQQIDMETSIANKAIGMPLSNQPNTSIPITSDDAFSQSLPRPLVDAQLEQHQLNECFNPVDVLNHRDDLCIEGGTIGISSVYSQGLLNSLTRALQSTGLDLSQATVSVQINLGKQANRGAMPATEDHDLSMPSGNQPVQDLSFSEDLDHQPEKRQKT